MGKITEYTKVSRFDKDDVLLKDGAAGTKTITAANAALSLADLISPINHRNIIPKRSLGSGVTSAQKTAIQNGTFDNLFVGDYWTIGGVTYRIADMDYWLYCGDTSLTKHHLVIVPDAPLYNAQMNTENVTTGGYTGSKMYTENLEQAKTTIQNAFGDLLLTRREYLTNAVTNGYPSGGAWFDSSVELMNEIMVYGTHVYAPANNGTIIPNKYTTCKQQLALFRLDPTRVNPTRAWYWLRDVVSSTGFAAVNSRGYAYYNGASTSNGVRPVFAIG